MSSGRRRWLLLGVGICVSGVLLFLSFRSIEFGDLSESLSKVSWPFLVLAAGTRFVNFCVVSLRSRLLFAPLHSFSLPFLFSSVLLAFSVNNVVPLRAGEVARIGYLARKSGLPASSCLAVIAVERLLDLMAVVVVILCTLPAMAIDLPLGTPFYVGAGLMVLFVGGAVWISRRPEVFVAVATRLSGLFGRAVRSFVQSKSEAFARGLSGLSSPTTVLAVAGLSLVFWALAAFGIQCWIWAFGFSLPWYAPVVVLSFLTFGLAVPSTPGHIGSFHFFAASAMMAIGVAEADAVSFAIVGHGMSVVPFTVLAMPILLREISKKRS